MTALILQARLDSTRLPQKALLPLGGEPLVFQVMRRLTRISADRYVLACPEDSATAFAPLADRAGFLLIVGPKDDVLARYAIAVRRLGADRLIRATGDNPFVLTTAAETIATEGLVLAADYAAYSGLPHGSGVENIAADALLRADRESRLPAEREHVCPYLYHHADLFLLHRPAAPVAWQGARYRVTVDTAEDLIRARMLFDLAGGENADDAALLAAMEKMNRP